MALTKDNLDAIVGLLTGLAQRQQAVFDLAQRLRTGSAWVGPDGKNAVDLTDDQRREMEQFIKGYTQESETVIAVIKQHLGDNPE